jgi:nucleoside-diphosphate-sugar epimerase
MRVLVTGGTGFIGIHLVAALVARGWRVRCLVRATSNRQPLAAHPVDYVVGHLQDDAALRQAVRHTDLIFHLAGATKARTAAEFDRVNVDGTRRLLAACATAATSLQAFVYVSSIAAAGPGASIVPVTEDDPPRPVGPYGESKRRAEEAVLSAGASMPVTVLRPSAIYGPYDTDFLDLFRTVKRGWLPCVGRQDLYVDLCHVADLVQGMLAAATCPATYGDVFFLGGSYHTWRDLGREIARQMGRRVRELRLPRALVLSAATLADTWARLSGQTSLLSRANLLERLHPFWLFDSSKAGRTFGYVPHLSLAEGVAQTLRWYQGAGWL